jgi:hypothetical protein
MFRFNPEKFLNLVCVAGGASLIGAALGPLVGWGVFIIAFGLLPTNV